MENGRENKKKMKGEGKFIEKGEKKIRRTQNRKKKTSKRQKNKMKMIFQGFTEMHCVISIHHQEKKNETCLTLLFEMNVQHESSD